MPLLPALVARLRREQSGFTLIETLVSAVMVVLISVGVLKTLDAAQARSGDQKSQSVAAGLAQQDQERLRAFRAQELNNLTETRCMGRGGTGLVDDPECDDPGKYKIISRTDWVSDLSGTRSCGTGARADYLRISSTVIWVEPDDAETGARRVSLTSIVAPRVGSFGDEGSLSVEILDRAGVGRAEVGVSITGPKNLSGKTDKNGCLFFGYLPNGNYTVNVSQPPLIDANGSGVTSRPFGVSSGSTTSAVIELDQAATLDASFSANKAGTSTTVPSSGDYVSIGHSSLFAPGWRAYGDGSPQASYSLSSLFPFTSGYAIYSGNCPGARPSFYGAADQFVTLEPGATASVIVKEPTIKLTPGGNGGSAWPGDDIPAGVSVKLTPRTTWGGSPTYCAGSKTYLTYKDASSGTGAYLANPDGTDLGIPVGAYDLCITQGGKYLLITNQPLIQPLTNMNGVSFAVPRPTQNPAC